MKNVSKLALFVAAGMVSAGVQAASFDVDENTTLSIEGEVKIFANETETVAGDDTFDTDGGSEFVIAAERNLGNGFTGYVETVVEYDTLAEDDDNEELTSGQSVVGFTGDFGEIQIGESDNIFEDVITDATDPFEEVGMPKASDTSETDMFTYYSPSFNGLSYGLQVRVLDEGSNDSDSTQESLIGAIEYAVGNVTFGAAYDDRGSIDSDDDVTDHTSEDPIFGLSAVIAASDVLEIGLKYAEESNEDGNDSDFSAVTVSYDYGAGNLYGGIGSESPETGDDVTKTAFGVDYGLADDFNLYAEYSDEDGTDDADTDSIMEAGFIFAF
ncbi:MAG: porin [Spiribacter sp.]|nr:porin [Spiribacter sp.]